MATFKLATPTDTDRKVWSSNQAAAQLRNGSERPQVGGQQWQIWHQRSATCDWDEEISDMNHCLIPSFNTETSKQTQTGVEGENL